MENKILSFYKDYYKFKKSTSIFKKLNLSTLNILEDKIIEKGLSIKENYKLIKERKFYNEQVDLNNNELIIYLDYKDKNDLLETYNFNFNSLEEHKKNKKIKEYLEENNLSYSSVEEQYIFLLKNKKIFDNNNFLISLYHIEVLIDSDEETELIIYPIVLYKITTEIRLNLYESTLNGKKFELKIDLKNNQNIILNNSIIETFFENKLKLNQNNLNYLSNNENETKEDFFKNIKKEFEINLKESKIKSITYNLPDFSKTTNKEPIFWIYNDVEFKSGTEIDFSLIENKKIKINNLLKKYFTTEDTDITEFKFNKYYGSNTKDFPLSAGQSKVLSEFQKGEILIPVVGAPGTGKTTLFKSIVANIITNRAINMIEGKKDYNSLILMTSTANKAIYNVYEEIIKENIFAGMCFFNIKDLVSLKAEMINDFKSNFSNKLERFNEIEQKEIIKKLNELNIEFSDSTSVIDLFILFTKNKLIIDTEIFKKTDEITKNNLKKKIIDQKSKIDKIIEYYLNIGEKIKYLEIYSYEDLQKEIENLIKKHDDKYLKEIIPDIEKINNHLNKKFIFKDIINIIENEYFIELKKINKEIFKNKTIFFKLKDLVFKETFNGIEEIKSFLNIKKNIKKENLIEVMNILENLEENIEEYKLYEKEYYYLEEMKELLNIEKNCIEDVFKYRNLEEFFQKSKYIFKENYKLYKLSECYLILEATEDKIILEKNLTNFSKICSFLQYSELTIEEIEEALRIGSIFFPLVGCSTQKLNTDNFVFKKNILGKNPFYCLLADEAGMIPSGSIIWSLNLSEKALIVGDPKQLEQIEDFKKPLIDTFAKIIGDPKQKYFKKYSPSETSAYQRAAGLQNKNIEKTGKGIILDEHRRCQEPIALLFKKIAKYPEFLKIETNKNIDKSKLFKKGEEFKHMMFYNYEPFKENKIKNTNTDEIEIIGHILDKLEEMNYDITKDVGIIAPYANQASLLINTYKERLCHSPENQKIGTVHSFQGAEYPVIIFSSVANEKDKNNLNFVSKIPLLNVAISRAKNLYIHVGDKKYLEKNNTFLEIYVPHFEKYGAFIETTTENEKNKINENIKIEENKDSILKTLTKSEEIIEELFEYINNAENAILFIVPFINNYFFDYFENNIKEKQLLKIKNKELKINIFYEYYNTSSKQSKNSIEEVKTLLKKYNLEEINIKQVKNGTHDKLAVFDKKILLSGSFNYLSNSAYNYLNSNYTLRAENCFVIQGKPLWDILEGRAELLNLTIEKIQELRKEAGF